MSEQTTERTQRVCRTLEEVDAAARQDRADDPEGLAREDLKRLARRHGARVSDFRQVERDDPGEMKLRRPSRRSVGAEAPAVDVGYPAYGLLHDDGQLVVDAASGGRIVPRLDAPPPAVKLLTDHSDRREQNALINQLARALAAVGIVRVVE